ncbi:NAD(P)-binding protein [Mycena sanguinolenta]|uniref:NAD(P)-binding protein n=1 Tax=Mycena sanguinolenta TaxID=230812 RepID=A0A8H7DD12_9AGAR|nr:NAD(P)-binding protein [Mycena sanguinolenta]
MSTKTVYLISGANRGIGYGLATTLAARPNSVVFAGARNPAAQSLQELAARHPNVHPVKLTSGDQADNEAAIAEIQKIEGQLDVVIANAGIAKHQGPLTTTPPAEFRDHFEVNTLGLVVLFQAAHALLLVSPTAAANFLVRALDAEHPALIAMAIHPGRVDTENAGNGGVTVEESVAGILTRIDGATKEKSSGRFWNFKAVKDGMPWDLATEEVPW